MNSVGPSSRFQFVVIVLIAVTLQILPSFTGLALWRPSFVLLVLIYFVLYKPYQYGIISAWLAGLLVDIVNGGVVGKYALALGVCAYILQLLRRRLLHAQIWHQCSLVFLLVLLSQLIVLSVNMLTEKQFSWQILFFPALSSMILWPFFYLLMRWKVH
jgi:rod shape-determining protein MreD